MPASHTPESELSKCQQLFYVLSLASQIAEDRNTLPLPPEKAEQPESQDTV